jgi:hypothetical protein
VSQLARQDGIPELTTAFGGAANGETTMNGYSPGRSTPDRRRTRASAARVISSAEGTKGQWSTARPARTALIRSIGVIRIPILQQPPAKSTESRTRATPHPRNPGTAQPRNAGTPGGRALRTGNGRIYAGDKKEVAVKGMSPRGRSLGLSRLRGVGRFCRAAPVLLLLGLNPIYGERPEEVSFRWMGPDGNPLPFDRIEELEAFLESAKIVEIGKIPVGITRPRKFLLERDGVRMHAIFRNVDDFKPIWRSPTGTKLDFHDSCMHEFVGYRLSRLLGVDHIPPVVVRTLQSEDFSRPSDFRKVEGAKRGTLQAWVEGAMTELDRQKRKIAPPDPRRWSSQMALMYLFDNLVCNEDRNLGNILIGPDWKVWFIDLTRAFRPNSSLPAPEKITRCDRELWKRLREISAEELRSEVGPHVRGRVVEGLVRRHELVKERIEELIAERGEEVVLVGWE